MTANKTEHVWIRRKQHWFGKMRNKTNSIDTNKKKDYFLTQMKIHISGSKRHLSSSEPIRNRTGSSPIFILNRSYMIGNETCSRRIRI